jgi:hypothetical protein
MTTKIGLAADHKKIDVNMLRNHNGHDDPEGESLMRHEPHGDDPYAEEPASDDDDRIGGYDPLSNPDQSAVALEDRLLVHELAVQRARKKARKIIDAEERSELPPFDAGTLGEILARPAPPISRVEDLVPWQASCLISAQRKTGKTTLVLNLAWSLLTGADFLGRFGVRPLDGNLAILNYEVSAAQLARWADKIGIPHDRLLLVNLRGRSNPLRDDEGRARLAAVLRSCDVEALLGDPFGRAYTGVSQNDPGEVGAWLADLERFARSEVGANDLMLTAHAGWEGERTRGSGALEDWPDSIMTMIRGGRREGDGGEETRYLKAIGRDVDLEEDRLNYDQETRKLALAGTGSRKAAASKAHAVELEAAILKIVQAKPDLNGTEIERELRQAGVVFQKGDEREALQSLVAREQLHKRPGKATPSSTELPNLPKPPRWGSLRNLPNLP